MKKNILTALVVFMGLSWTIPCFAAEKAQQTIIKPFEYTIRSGDNLTHIAVMFNTTVKQLMEVNEGNPSVKSKDLILKGSQLIVPDLYPLEEIEKELIIQDKAIEQLQLKNRALEKNLLVRNFSLLIISCIAALLLIVLVSVVRGQKKDEELYHQAVKLKDRTIESKEQTINELVLIIKYFRKWQTDKIEELKKLNIQLDVKEQQINALQIAKQEAERLSNELAAVYKLLGDKDATIAELVRISDSKTQEIKRTHTSQD